MAVPDTLKKGETSTITFTLSETAIDFALEDVVETGGILGTWTAVSGTSYTAIFTPTDESTTGGTINVAAGTFTDAAGNANTIAPEETITIDTEAPTFTIQYYSDSELETAVNDNAYLKAGTYYIKITASESMNSAPTITLAAEGTANDVTNAVTTSATGNDYKYTRVIIADVLAIGAVLEDISVTGTDSAGNVSTNIDPTNEGTKAIYTDTVAPTVDAGSDAGAVGEQFTQDATASDGGSGIATYTWTKESGPYTVTFGTSTAVDTTVDAAGEGFYTIRLTVTDTAGNSAYDETSFTWGAVNVPIVAYSPINGVTDVAIADGTATITFGGSENITLLEANNVTLVDNGTGTSKKGTVAVSGGDGSSKILNIPYTELANSTVYRINILSGAIRDSIGHINSDGVSYFTTVAATGDVTDPKVSAQFPTDNTTSTAVTISPTVTFDEAMDSDTVNTNTVQLRAYSGDAVVNASITYVTGTHIATIDPVASLDYDTQYYIWVSGAKDVAGNTVEAYATKADQEFTTAADTTPGTPTVAIVTPSAGDEIATASYNITFTTNSTTTTAAYISIDGGSWVAATSNASPGTYTLDVSALTNGSHTVRVKDTVSAVVGYSDYVTFITAYQPDSTNPTVSSIYPTDNSTNVAVTLDPYVDFSEAMDRTTLTSANIKLCLVSDSDCSSPITTPISISEGDTRAVLVHGANLANNTAYWIYVGTGVKDVVGNALETAYGSTTASNFTTVALGNGSLEVTSIVSRESYASAGAGWPDDDPSTADGWSWKFYITVPSDETLFEMKFDNWTSGDNSILVADNMRFYSTQATTAVDAAHAIDITAHATYSADMTLSGDLYPTTAGRQIMVTVEMQVPAGSSGGSYSTSYGVKSDAPAS